MSGYPALSLNPSPREIAERVNGILRGHLNAVSTVTLTANAATTTFADPRLSASSFIAFMPTTANAAAALGGLWVSGQTKGACTLNHTNNAQTDRAFSV